jgi:tRNA (guanine-N7-)-methyltransferase
MRHAGLVPAIHVFLGKKSWMPGTRPGMTRREFRGFAMSEARPLRSYGRRKARPLSERKDRLLAELLPTLRLPLTEPAPIPLAKLFARPLAEIWLEIGFGSGEHLAGQAEQHRDIGFIGCEPFVNGVASLLGRIETSGIDTVRIHDGDARDVLAWLPAASVGRVFVLFPDPWPKHRHAKRRLLSPETVVQLARALKPGGELRFATDSSVYAGEALRALLASGAFRWTAERAKDWRIRPADWPETRYERKALSAGRKPAYLSFRRL